MSIDMRIDNIIWTYQLLMAFGNSRVRAAIKTLLFSKHGAMLSNKRWARTEADHSRLDVLPYAEFMRRRGKYYTKDHS
jgi:hypothetical protein